MEKQAIKEFMYGGVNELMQNRRYYYRSSTGRQYSKWTEEGQEAMISFMQEMTQHIYNAEQQAVDQRAKDMVLKELKS